MPPPFCISLSLSLQSKEITFQLQEDLMKVLNELYTVSVLNFVRVKVIFLHFILSFSWYVLLPATLRSALR